MNSPQPAPTHQSWLAIFGALVLSVFVHGLIGFFMDNGTNPRAVNTASVIQLRPFIVAAAVAMLVTAVAWLRFRVDGKIGGEGRPVMMSPEEFQRDSIMALALAEACTIFGLFLFFLGTPLQEFALFGAGTLLVDFAFILPRGLQFWSAYNRNSNI